MNSHIFIGMITLGVLLPYVAVAAAGWVDKKRTRRPDSGDAEQV